MYVCMSMYVYAYMYVRMYSCYDVLSQSLLTNGTCTSNRESPNGFARCNLSSNQRFVKTCVCMNVCMYVCMYVRLIEVAIPYLGWSWFLQYRLLETTPPGIPPAARLPYACGTLRSPSWTSAINIRRVTNVCMDGWMDGWIQDVKTYIQIGHLDATRLTALPSFLEIQSGNVSGREHDLHDCLREETQCKRLYIHKYI